MLPRQRAKTRRIVCSREVAVGGRGEKYTAHGGASIAVVYLKDESNGHAGSSLAAFLSFDSFMECVYLEMECFVHVFIKTF